MPSTDAGRPCTRNSHCQPCQPLTPSIHFMMAPDSGPAMTLAKVGGRHEDRDHLAAPRRRVPVGEVQDDAGEEAGLEGAEQEAQHVELRRRLHEHHAGGDDAPADHDAQQRLARADLLQHQVARHLEQEVADEEDAGAQAVDRVAEGQRLLHLQLRVADVDAVEVGDDVADDQQRHDAPADLREHRVARVRGRRMATVRRSWWCGVSWFRLLCGCVQCARLPAATASRLGAPPQPVCRRAAARRRLVRQRGLRTLSRPAQPVPARPLAAVRLFWRRRRGGFGQAPAGLAISCSAARRCSISSRASSSLAAARAGRRSARIRASRCSSAR